MYVAGDPSLALVALTCLGGYLSAGGAGAINHYFDRDIDARMARTANRPIPAGRIAPRAALAFGCSLAALSLLELSLAVNPLAAGLSFAGFLGYVGVYTVVAQAPHAAEHRDRRRRRRGARRSSAGPRCTGRQRHGGDPVLHRLLLDAAALLGALAADEGRVRARSACRCCRSCAARRETRRQILLYSVLLYAVTQLPFCAGGFGVIYLAASIALGLGFIGGAVRLYRARRPPRGAAALPLLARLPRAAVRRDGRSTPICSRAICSARHDDPQPRPQEHPHGADRVGAFCMFMFGLTFVVAAIYISS